MNISNANLRRVLAIDGFAGAAMGLSHLFGAGALSDWTGMPVVLLQVAAVVVLGAACLATALALRAVPSSGWVRLLAAGNFAWVLASLWVAWGAGLPLTDVGMAWVIGQAVAVFVLAELEWMGSGPATRLVTA